MNRYRLFSSLLVSALVATSCLVSCSEKIDMPSENNIEAVKITASLDGFEGAVKTKVTNDLDAFTVGDRIRLMIICPHTSGHELGETWGSYYNTTIKTDSNGNWYLDNSGSSTVGSYEAQKTTYIYSAVYSPMTRYFVYNNFRYVRPSIWFHADQRKLEDYKTSDLIWAQAVRQTGASSVHMNFQHKMARLDITIDDSALSHETFDSEGNSLGEQSYPFSNESILTLENMPDIDGAEVVVGDYYADESYASDNWNRFNYREKASCSYENNGKVIGIEVVDDDAGRAKIYGMTGNPSPAGGNYNKDIYGTVPNTGTYTAYHDPANSKHFMLLVPPCVLQEGHPAVFWLRDGTRRYSVTLDQMYFEEGHNYNVTLKFTN